MAGSDETKLTYEHDSKTEFQSLQPATGHDMVFRITDERPDTTNTSANTQSGYSPLFLSSGSPSTPDAVVHDALSQEIAMNDPIAIILPPVQRRWEYRTYDDAPVAEVLEEFEDSDTIQYLINLRDGRELKVPFTSLIQLRNGAMSLQRFNEPSDNGSSSGRSAVGVASKSNEPRRSKRLVDMIESNSSSDDQLTTAKPVKTRQRVHLSAPRASKSGRPLQRNSNTNSSRSHSTSRDTSSEAYGERRKPRSRGTLKTRTAGNRNISYDDTASLDDSNVDESEDIVPHLGKRKRIIFKASGARKTRILLRGPRFSDSAPTEGIRRSERSRKPTGDMRELGEDEIPDNILIKDTTKAVGAKENYKDLPRDNDFRLRHCQTCDTCHEYGNDHEKGHLVFCQGCTVSYHQRCLGPRTAREHLVTKVGEKNFVLQCRRCIGAARKKEQMAPNQGDCQICNEPGISSIPFRDRKTTAQEQKDREENHGEDPIADVPGSMINNARNVLFRCAICYRAFHLHHLPVKGDIASQESADEDQLATDRFREYCQDWACTECATAPAEVESLIAWRPVFEDQYIPGISTELVKEDAKQYLIKWKKMSYFRSTWMPGGWVWGVTTGSMRKAFARRDNQSNLPKMRTEDAIPEEFLRVDIVLDVVYTNVVKVQAEKVDMARIKEVEKALVKFKGLGYEDVVWEEPPEPEDTERWIDFKSAYDDWVRGKYVHLPIPQSLKSHLSKIRTQNFERQIMMQSQPETLTGGKLMDYQMDGLNWLYYQWHRRQNALLADEMGLGKTIQIIGFLATLKYVHGCWPFLIVVPNSTCPNWRRELKQWAPSLRVVTYFGSAEARKLALKHELFPGGGKDLRCHVVITSYDAAQDDEFRRVFRGVAWQGLVVDEGQRLKNDRNILYGALSALKAPFKVLLTGTPLQNNPRELFNLLQFLDASIDAQAMEQEYLTLTKDNVPKLHDLLRPFFLRRTKAQVLTFLPSMAQIIVPVTLTVVQKKLYRSILAKSPELIKAIFGGSQRALKANERASLNNILMQLRKCLCHPFVYSRAIEERSSNAAVSHRNLVDASSKLQLLEIMLPKLQERGHRVLIFSQFLDMLDMVEDFLDGLGLYYQRLDGNVSSLQKQKRIDEYNAPESPLFAFLLSTRAGGVGINLATADTVIILDPDFNPHQDIQALSRAHRIGQKKKVLVFQLTTRATAEEKIMQIGKKKMALDHVLIEQMDAEEDAGMDLESILRHGAGALFKDDDAQDIRYDSASVDKLLDRSQTENTDIGKDDSAESQFSFARVWANDKGLMEDALENLSDGDEHAPDPSIWEKILKEREREVELEAAAKAEVLGRGRRARQTVDYAKQTLRDLAPDSPRKDAKGKYAEASDSDTDFQARAGAESDGEESAPGGDDEEQVTVRELQETQKRRQSKGVLGSQDSPVKEKSTRGFKRVEVPLLSLHGKPLPPGSTDGINDHYNSQDNKPAATAPCIACNKPHPLGFCPLKIAGVENCGLCGLAHYGSGFQRNCPHLNSITQCRAMLEALKQSPEPKEYKDQAKKYIVGIIGDLNRRKKLKEAQTLQQASSSKVQSPATATASTSKGSGKSRSAPKRVSEVESGKENRVGTSSPASMETSRPRGKVVNQELLGE